MGWPKMAGRRVRFATRVNLDHSERSGSKVADLGEMPRYAPGRVAARAFRLCGRLDDRDNYLVRCVPPGIDEAERRRQASDPFGSASRASSIASQPS